MGKIIKMYKTPFQKEIYKNYKDKGYWNRIMNYINKNLLVNRLTRKQNESNGN